MPTPSSLAATRPVGRTRVSKPQTRPTRSSINTDVGAHSRTNPIGALNTLLKLLSSLPKRLGGCQLKLTPAEHALSLHLMSILDPYVYQGAKALSTVASAQAKPTISGLVYQPTEILDCIMAYLDSKRDLLSVGLCCRHLYDVVFPRHFEYRVIRCKVSSISVWNHLLVNHSLARNVRTLEIVDERSSSATTVFPRGAKSATATATTTALSAATAGMIIPLGITQRDTDFESTDDELDMHRKQEKYLSLALQRMSGLRELKWSSNHSPISIERVWPALLQRSATLDTVIIADNLVFASKDVAARTDEEGSDSENENESKSGEGGSDPVHAMATVTNAVFKSTRHNYGACKNPNLSRIADILARCPNLQNLDIAFIRPRSSQTSLLPLLRDDLLDGRWTHLTGLTLTGLYCTSSSALSDFIMEHPQLERLHLDVSIAGLGANRGLEVKRGSLPRLRELHASKEVVNSILEADLVDDSGNSGTSVQVLRPLETVKGIKLSGVHASPSSSSSNANANIEVKHIDAALIRNLKQHSKTLTRVELAGWNDMEDIRQLASSLPGLVYLDVGKRLSMTVLYRGGNGGKAGASGPVANVGEWLEILETLPELRTLHGVKFFYVISTNYIPGSSLNANSTAFSTGFSGSSSSYHHHHNSVSTGSTLANTTSPNTAVSLAASFAESSSPSPFSINKANQMSLMDRSRMKKNDCTASMLAWKCPKLRRVDFWEEGVGRVIVLTRGVSGSPGAVGSGGRGAIEEAAAAEVGGGGGGGGGGDGVSGNARESSSKVRWEVRKVKLG